MVGLGTALDLDSYIVTQMVDTLKDMQEIMEKQIGSLASKIDDGLPGSDGDLSGE
jgi:hypothetical protein